MIVKPIIAETTPGYYSTSIILIYHTGQGRDQLVCDNIAIKPSHQDMFSMFM